MNQYFIIYKPFGMLSQFTAEGDKATLAQLGQFPPDVYPVGRLDADSEGLLILTNDKELNHRLLNPKFRHKRTYLAQVDGAVTPEAIEKLCKGVTITVDGRPYATLPAQAKALTAEPGLPERIPPIRYRKSIPTSWVELTLHEGKNRQVRKMTASVGFPTLRLVRVAIEGIQLGGMQPGEVRELYHEKIYRLLFG
ncbi:MAG: pseudouridine synthase [Bacteroidota bacterium]|nr:pseudouridine synthase [Bacteroidota bacterium]